MSTGQVARALGVSRSAVQRWARLGKIPASRTLGGHLRFWSGDIINLGRVAVPMATDPAALSEGGLLLGNGSIWADVGG